MRIFYSGKEKEIDELLLNARVQKLQNYNILFTLRNENPLLRGYCFREFHKNIEKLFMDAEKYTGVKIDKKKIMMLLTSSKEVGIDELYITALTDNYTVGILREELIRSILSEIKNQFELFNDLFVRLELYDIFIQDLVERYEKMGGENKWIRKNYLVQ